MINLSEGFVAGLKVLGVLLVLFLLGWAIFEYVCPHTASWREIPDEQHTEVYYAPQTSCDGKGNCSTTMTPIYNTICDVGHWQCIKGRDGTTQCQDAIPNFHTCRRLRDY